MSSASETPHIIHFLDASPDAFREYLSNFGRHVDFNDIETSIKTPGYIVGGEVVEKYPPAYHSSGFYNTIFIIQPEGFPGQARLVVRGNSPRSLEDIDRKSLIAAYNPKYFLGLNGLRSFSLGPEPFVLWFSKTPPKQTKKRPATSPVKSSVPDPKNLRLSPLKTPCNAAISVDRNADRLQMPPPSSWIDVGRRRHQNQLDLAPLDNSRELTCHSSRAGSHSGCDHTGHSHVAHSTCSTHHHCAPQHASCCHNTQPIHCSSRQCCSHGGVSGCHGCQPSHSCHRALSQACCTRGHFGSCTLGCGSRCCSDPHEADCRRSARCSKHHSHDRAPVRSCSGSAEPSLRPGPSHLAEELLNPAAEARNVGASAESGWFVRNWVEQSTLENERAPTVPNFESQQTRATFGDSYLEAWNGDDDDDGHWSSISEQIAHRKIEQQMKKEWHQNRCLPKNSDPPALGSEGTVRRSNAHVQIREPATRENDPKIPEMFKQMARKKTEKSHSSGPEGRAPVASPARQIQIGPSTSRAESLEIKDSQASRVAKNPEQVESSENSQSENTPPLPLSRTRQAAPKAQAPSKPKPLSLRTGAYTGGASSAQGPQAHSLKHPSSNTPCHSGSGPSNQLNSLRQPKPLRKPETFAPKPMQDNESDSDDSDISSLFLGKTQSLLLGGATNKNSEAPKEQSENVNNAVVSIDSSDEEPKQQSKNVKNAVICVDSSDEESNSVEVGHEQPEQRDKGSREDGPTDTQLTCLDTLLPPPPEVFMRNPPVPDKKKHIRKLYNPADNSWYFNGPNPGDTSLIQHENASGEGRSKEPEVSVVASVASNPAEETSAIDKKSGERKLPSSAGSKLVVESPRQDTDDEIIPPSDAENIPVQTDAREGDRSKPPEDKGQSESVGNILAFVEDWKSDSSCSNEPRSITKSTAEVLSDLLNAEPSGEAIKILDSFKSLHAPPPAEAGACGPAGEQVPASDQVAADQAVEDSNEPLEREPKPGSAGIVTEASSQQKVVSDSGSLISSGSPVVPSSQPQHDNRVLEEMQVQTSCGVDMSLTLCQAPSAESPATRRPDRPDGGEPSGGGGNEELPLQHPESAELNLGQENSQCKNEETLDQETKPKLPVACTPNSDGSSESDITIRDPVAGGNSAGTGPANPGTEETADSPKKLFNAANHPQGSQASSELNLRITDSPSTQSPESDKTVGVAKKAEAHRRSPDSTTDHLSEEHISFEPPQSPASTVFYDAEEDEDQNEDLHKPTDPAELPPKESDKTSPDAAENDDISRRLTLPDQAFGVHATIFDVKPTVTPETRMDIVKGFCASGCQSKFEYERAAKEKTMIRPCSKCSLRRHHLCPVCKKSGQRRPLCWQFFFEIHVMIGPHRGLRLLVEMEEAVKFLGIDVKTYLKRDAASLKTVHLLEGLSDTTPDKKKRRFEGQVLIRTEERPGEGCVPLLIDTDFSDLRLSRDPI